MSLPATVTCPTCGTVLMTDGLMPGQNILCTRCATQLKAPGDAPAIRTSKMAVTSLVLGLLSIVGTLIVGLPAIVAGILGLANISRSRGRLTGKGLAISGILSASVLGTCSTAGVIAIVLLVRSIGWTTDPTEVDAMAAEMGTFQKPTSLTHGVGVRFFVFNMVIYADTPMQPQQGEGEAAPRPTGQPNSMLMLMKFPQGMEQNQDQMNAQMQQQMQMQGGSQLNVEETRQDTYTINDQEVVVNVSIGTDNTGRKMRHYMAFVPGDNGPVMVMIMTSNEPDASAEAPAEGETPTAGLSEDEVKAFFESFQ